MLDVANGWNCACCRAAAMHVFTPFIAPVPAKAPPCNWRYVAPTWDQQSYARNRLLRVSNTLIGTKAFENGRCHMTLRVRPIEPDSKIVTEAEATQGEDCSSRHFGWLC